jgi:hypothetical protein
MNVGGIKEMLKKAALAVFGLVLAMNISTSRAQAEVHVVAAIGAPAVYAGVAVQPVRYGYYNDAPYAAYNQAPYAYDYAPNGAYAGPYYGSDQYYGAGQYYAPDYSHQWRKHRHHHRVYRDHRWERKHERWHEKHRRDRW